jgi:hypothetical protein
VVQRNRHGAANNAKNFNINQGRFPSLPKSLPRELTREVGLEHKRLSVQLPYPAISKERLPYFCGCDRPRRGIHLYHLNCYSECDLRIPAAPKIVQLAPESNNPENRRP